MGYWNELKPCPFCGAEAELDARRAYKPISGNKEFGTAIAVYCVACAAEISVCREDVPNVEPEEVIEAWNRRTPAKVTP